MAGGDATRQLRTCHGVIHLVIEGEGGAMVANLWLAFQGPDDGDDVEARAEALEAAGADEPVGGGAEAFAFGVADGGFGGLEVFRGEAADFDEDEIVAIEGDDIQLTAGAADVAGEKFEAEGFAGVLGGEVFGAGAEREMLAIAEEVHQKLNHI